MRGLRLRTAQPLPLLLRPRRRRDRRRGRRRVDPSGDEEIDFLARGKARGANFGWNVFEGRKRFRKGSLLLSPAAGSGNRAFGRVVSPTSFGEDALGRIYVASFTGGVYRLASS